MFRPPARMASNAPFPWGSGKGLNIRFRVTRCACQTRVFSWIPGGRMGGIVTWAEGVGMWGRRGMLWQLELGSLVSRYPGVYAAPGHLGPWLNELEAVVTWAGRDALASYRSAAFLHSLDLLGRCGLEVTVPPRRNPRPPSATGHEPVRVHRSEVPGGERTVLSGIPCTSLAWTCLDLAATLERVPLAVVVESAWRKRPKSFVGWLTRALDQHKSGKKGVRTLEALLADCAGRKSPMRSSFEVQLWHYLISRQHELELPIPGHEVFDAIGKMEIDFAWLRQKLAVETNGWGVHGTWKAFNSDADRTSRLVALGWRVLPVTHRMFDQAPGAVFERIRAALALAEATRAA